VARQVVLALTTLPARITLQPIQVAVVRLFTEVFSMRISLAGVLLLSCLALPAFALPPIPKYIPVALEGKAEYKEYLTAFKASAKKCSSCHIPDADKKAKGHALNDFGQAMHKHLDDKGFMAADKAKKMDEALKLFNEAWGKAVLEKNADGQTFNDLLKEGKNPGKNPDKKE
jgi:hypothetical protein